MGADEAHREMMYHYDRMILDMIDPPALKPTLEVEVARVGPRRYAASVVSTEHASFYQKMWRTQ